MTNTILMVEYDIILNLYNIKMNKIKKGEIKKYKKYKMYLMFINNYLSIY